jgi:hypothetical protein
MPANYDGVGSDPDHEDKPTWLGWAGAAALVLAVATAIVSIIGGI